MAEWRLRLYWLLAPQLEYNHSWQGSQDTGPGKWNHSQQFCCHHNTSSSSLPMLLQLHPHFVQTFRLWVRLLSELDHMQLSTSSWDLDNGISVSLQLGRMEPGTGYGGWLNLKAVSHINVQICAISWSQEQIWTLIWDTSELGTDLGVDHDVCHIWNLLCSSASTGISLSLVYSCPTLLLSILILPLYYLKRKFIWGSNSLYICLLLIGLIQVQATLLCPTRNWHWQTLADMQKGTQCLGQGDLQCCW